MDNSLDGLVNPPADSWLCSCSRCLSRSPLSNNNSVRHYHTWHTCQVRCERMWAAVHAKPTPSNNSVNMPGGNRGMEEGVVVVDGGSRWEQFRLWQREDVTEASLTPPTDTVRRTVYLWYFSQTRFPDVMLTFHQASFSISRYNTHTQQIWIAFVRLLQNSISCQGAVQVGRHISSISPLIALYNWFQCPLCHSIFKLLLIQWYWLQLKEHDEFILSTLMCQIFTPAEPTWT